MVGTHSGTGVRSVFNMLNSITYDPLRSFEILVFKTGPVTQHRANTSIKIVWRQTVFTHTMQVYTLCEQKKV